MVLGEVIHRALGDKPVDLLLTGARIINVASAEIHEGCLAVADGTIVGFEPLPARETLDLEGRYAAPGFIDGHIHLESSMVLPAEFARAVVPWGTTAVVTDPHEIANVLGPDGVRLLLALSEGLPLTVYCLLPSMLADPQWETPGARWTARDFARLKQESRVVGLAEVPATAVVGGDTRMLARLAWMQGRPIDGHAPGVTGRELSALAAVGIRSDHESVALEEAAAKLRVGFTVMIREGTAAKNLAALLPLVRPETVRRFLLVTDDVHPTDLVEGGHLAALVSAATRAGLDPVSAVQMVTCNVAEYFRLPRRGALLPGYRADIVVFEEWDPLRPTLVLAAGQVVAREGVYFGPVRQASPAHLVNTVRIAPIALEDLSIPAGGEEVRVIEVVPDQILTRQRVEAPPVVGGLVVADPAGDLAKLVIVERHRATGNVGLGLVRGLGLRRGAVASSVAHDAHHLIAAGVDDADLLRAVETVAAMGGGFAVVDGGQVTAQLALPVAGLLSPEALPTVATNCVRCVEAARQLGSPLENPFMTLSFLALPVIPDLKLTDRGLVDVAAGRRVELFVGRGAEEKTNEG
ncbi:MAG: adenine deaminase [Nitrospinota bacterium]